jgi:hypothetical protein
METKRDRDTKHSETGMGLFIGTPPPYVADSSIFTPFCCFYQIGAYEKVLAVVGNVVADVLALGEVDDVLGDVGGVVADALEVLGNED